MEIVIAFRDFNVLRFELFTIGKYFSLCFFETGGGFSLLSISSLSNKYYLGFYVCIFYKEFHKEFIKKEKVI